MSCIDDVTVRAKAFDWLAEQVSVYGDVLPRAVLQAGFVLDGVRVPLLGPQGIFKPKVISTPISITTSPGGPYDDAFGADGLLRYRYRGIDPNHYENQALRHVMENRIPLVYFHGITPGRYLATWPVFVVADDPANLAVTVDVEAAESLFLEASDGRMTNESDSFARRYAAAQVRVRLHQRSFRERVLTAYRHQCAFCQLRHGELLDAAHIVPDADPLGEPLVSNGLALCALHHSAYDRQFMGVRPDYFIEVRPDILAEHDGPTLSHAIQALHGRQITLPRSMEQRPNPSLLGLRYERFLQAS